MISATQTVPVQSSASPNATANLLNNRENNAKIRNQDGTEIGDSPLPPIVINEFTSKLRTRKAETRPYRDASLTP